MVSRAAILLSASLDSDSDDEREPCERGGGPEGTHPDVEGWGGGTPERGGGCGGTKVAEERDPEPHEAVGQPRDQNTPDEEP